MIFFFLGRIERVLILSKDKILKKTAFGGFKKEDVLDYIEKLQQEIVDLRREASDCAAYKREAESLIASKTEAESSVAALQAEIKALKAENSGLIENNAALTLKIEQLTSILEKSKADASEIEEKYESLVAEYSKITDIDALVAEARSSVSQIATCAKSSVDSVYADVSVASDRLRTVTVNYESSLASLKARTEALLSALSSASEKLGAVGSKEE